MADSAPAASVPKVKKSTKPKKPADHPKSIEMVVAALKELKERGGSSKIKILKYIMANYKVGDEKTVNTHLKTALKNGVKAGTLKQTKGIGASGSFKLEEVAKKAPAKPKKPTTKKPAAKKPTAKKPAAKKTTAKKSPKKAAKKPATKKAKTPTKKTVKKSPKKTATKKPVAKKSASKKLAKSPKKPVKKSAAKKPKA